MGHLQDKSVYLGGAISNCPLLKQGINWRPPVIQELETRFGLNVFDPLSDPKQQFVDDVKRAQQNKDEHALRMVATGFVQKDLQKVARCDFTIHKIVTNVDSPGSTDEIMFASRQLKNPTLIVCEEGRFNLSTWYWGCINPEFLFSSWDELYDYLAEVDDPNFSCGMSRRWNMVREII